MALAQMGGASWNERANERTEGTAYKGLHLSRTEWVSQVLIQFLISCLSELSLKSQLIIIRDLICDICEFTNIIRRNCFYYRRRSKPESAYFSYKQ